MFVCVKVIEQLYAPNSLCIGVSFGAAGLLIIMIFNLIPIGKQQQCSYSTLHFFGF